MREVKVNEYIFKVIFSKESYLFYSLVFESYFDVLLGYQNVIVKDFGY